MCRDFTPELTSFLAKNGEKSAVLVSSDFNKADFDQHRGNLPASMLAVPYGTELQDSEFFFSDWFLKKWTYEFCFEKLKNWNSM